MTGLSQGTARAIAAKFPWKRFDSLPTSAVPKAGGGGNRVGTPASQRPGMDLPVVRPSFETYVTSKKLQKRDVSRRELFEESLTKGMCSSWGVHPARLGISKKNAAAAQGVCGIAERRRVDRP